MAFLVSAARAQCPPGWYRACAAGDRSDRAWASPAGSSRTGNGGEEIRCGNDVLLLVNSVVAFGVEDIVLAEAVVEHAEPGAQHGLDVFAFSQSPGKPEARSKIGMVVNLVLRFEAQAAAEGHVRADFPIVFHIGLDVVVVERGGGISGRQGELAGASAVGPNLRRGRSRLQTLFGNLVGRERWESERSVEVGVGGCGFSVDRAPGFRTSRSGGNRRTDV